MSVNDILIIAGFVFIIGLCIGSFLNVVILRALSNESIVFPPSKCPVCSNRLKWWHNIPVLSYILLRGKCGFCGCKISIQYPIVELVTGLLFTAVFLKYFVVALATSGVNLGTYFAIGYSWIIISLLIVIAVTDIKEKVVFDAHTYTLIGMGLLLHILGTGYLIHYIAASTGSFHLSIAFLLNNPLTNSLAGIILGVIIMELLARSGYLFAGTRAFGEGDTYIAAGLGAIFGWQKILWALVLSIVIQVVITLPILLKKLYTNKDYKTFTALSGFFVYAILYYFLKDNSVFSILIIQLLSALILAGSGIYVCVRIIKSMRDGNHENMIYLPFGPAMAIAALLMTVI